MKRGMITFHVSKEIHASLDEIWNLVSDIDREPEFWHGTKSVKNTRKVGNIVERETVIAFRNAVCKEIVTLDAKNSIKKKILSGPITGTKDIKITPLAANKTRVDVQWNITVRGFFRLFRGRLKKHISQRTWEALDRIATTVT
jgi:ribosome-associated toxin RatA of RatAB toxin-antitoxin module